MTSKLAPGGTCTGTDAHMHPLTCCSWLVWPGLGVKSSRQMGHDDAWYWRSRIASWSRLIFSSLLLQACSSMMVMRMGRDSEPCHVHALSL